MFFIRGDFVLKKIILILILMISMVVCFDNSIFIDATSFDQDVDGVSIDRLTNIYSIYDEKFNLLFQKDAVEIGDGYMSPDRKYMPEYKIRLIEAQEEQIKLFPDEELLLLLEKPERSNNKFTDWRTWVICNWVLATGNRAATICDVAIGNIVGSNIFNVALIIGVSGVISPFQIESISTVDMVMVVASIVMLWLAAFTFKRYKLDRIEGVIFLLAYVGYIAYLALNI
jgi:hypothetical protein